MAVLPANLSTCALLNPHPWAFEFVLSYSGDPDDQHEKLPSLKLKYRIACILKFTFLYTPTFSASAIDFVLC